MHLLYCSYGNRLEDHLQIAFSAISFLQQANEISSVNIITDGAPFYKQLSNRVNIIETPSETFKKWRGPYDFSWRIKIEAIGQVARQYAGSPVVYLDGDSFLYGNINLLKASLHSGKAHMHDDEGPLSAPKTKTWRKFWNDIKGKKYGDLLMEPKYHMWNAGVVAIPNNQSGKEIALALSICDEMCATVTRKTLAEQYALSVALEEVYTLGEAKNYIAHYWSNKAEWNSFILKWFAECHLKQKTLDEMIEHFSELPLEKIPIGLKRKSTETKLKKLVDKMFAPTDIRYLENRP